MSVADQLWIARIDTHTPYPPFSLIRVLIVHVACKNIRTIGCDVKQSPRPWLVRFCNTKWFGRCRLQVIKRMPEHEIPKKWQRFIVSHQVPEEFAGGHWPPV